MGGVAAAAVVVVSRARPDCPSVPPVPSASFRRSAPARLPGRSVLSGKPWVDGTCRGRGPRGDRVRRRCHRRRRRRCVCGREREESASSGGSGRRGGVAVPRGSAVRWRRVWRGEETRCGPGLGGIGSLECRGTPASLLDTPSGCRRPPPPRRRPAFPPVAGASSRRTRPRGLAGPATRPRLGRRERRRPFSRLPSSVSLARGCPLRRRPAGRRGVRPPMRALPGCRRGVWRARESAPSPPTVRAPESRLRRAAPAGGWRFEVGHGLLLLPSRGGPTSL